MEVIKKENPVDAILDVILLVAPPNRRAAAYRVLRHAEAALKHRSESSDGLLPKRIHEKGTTSEESIAAGYAETLVLSAWDSGGIEKAAEQIQSIERSLMAFCRELDPRSGLVHEERGLE